MAADLLALAERVEQAAGADRELDGPIQAALGPDHPFHYSGVGVVNAFTASLDAAMTLVPDRWRWEVTTTGFKPGASVVGFKLPVQYVESYAATPALALCAAALRARAQLAGEEK